MKTFKIRALADWNRVAPDDVLEFTVTEGGRKLALDFNVSAPVQIWAATNADMEGEVLLAASDGLFSVEFAAREPVYVQVRSSAADAVVFFKTWAADHVVAKVSDEKYTTIEMRRQRNSEMERMMLLLRHNAQQREAKLAAEMATLKSQLDAMKVQADANADGQVVEPAGADGGGESAAKGA